MYTLTAIRDLLSKRLKGKRLPDDWEPQVKEYLKTKQELVDRDDKDFKEDKGLMKRQLREVERYYSFLKRPNLDDFDLPDTIPVAGMFKKGFIIEPLDTWTYVYNWCGLKGLVKVEKDPNPESKRFYCDIEGCQVPLLGKPIERFVFKLPDKKLIKLWLSNRVASPTSTELYDEMYKLFDTFIELHPKSLFSLMILFVFQSWLVEKLKTVFFLSIMGEFGGGKTCVLEILTMLSKHGYMTPNPSTSFVGRTIESQRLTLTVDEIDCLKGTEDSDLIQLIRTSYRKGAQFSRINLSTMEPDSFRTFGVKAFTAHTDLEQALQTRTMPVITTEALDNLVPVISYVKDEYCDILFNKLFLWYMDSGVGIEDFEKSIKDLATKYSEGVNYDRKTIYDNIITPLNAGQHSQLSKLSGRNAELGLVIANLLRMLELTDDNLPEHINEAFKIKKELEEEKFDTGDVGLCRDFLVDKYKKYRTNHNFITHDGEFKVANKDIYEGFNLLLRDKGKRGITPSEFKGFLRDFGFEHGASRKKMRIVLEGELGTIQQAESKIRLCCIYTPKVLKKLALPVELLKAEESTHGTEVKMSEKK